MGDNITLDISNKRTILKEYDKEEIMLMHEEIKDITEKYQLTKSLVYSVKADLAQWEKLGYKIEGKIDGLFAGRTAYILAMFYSDKRAKSIMPDKADEILKKSIAIGNAPQGEGERELLDGFTMREANESDADALAILYDKVFINYPTPISDPEYIVKTMRDSTGYALVENNGQIVCVASAEVDISNGSAELTDCATNPEFRGLGLLQILFRYLEDKMVEKEVFYLYTLTRAQSIGMNITAAKRGFVYRGCLVNNSQISTGYEDLNIWVKPLRGVYE